MDVDSQTLIETAVKTALRTIPGVEGVYGEADLPLKKNVSLPGFMVTIPGNENFEEIGSEGWSTETLFERTGQLDLGCLADESRLTFMPIVRDLRNAAVSKLSDLDALGVPGLIELKPLAVQRTQYPSDEGTIGGLYIAYRYRFVSPIGDFAKISPRF